MDEDFNKAAENRAAFRRQLLGTVAEARRDDAFAAAVKREDWQAAIALHEAGADPHHRDNAALKAIQTIDSIAAAEALEKITVPGYPRLAQTPYLVAGRTGNIATLEHGMAKGMAKETLSSALFFALQEKHDDAADLILTQLKPADMQENALFALLMHRPDAYESALAARGDKADYFAQFYAACDFNHAAAMETSLEKMIAHRDALPPQIFMGREFFDEYMGPPPFMQLAAKVIETGNAKILDRLIDAFPEQMPPAYLMLVWTLQNDKDQVALLSHIAQKMNAKDGDMYAVVMNLAGHADAAQYVADHHLEAAQHYPVQVLRGFLSDPKADIAALAEKYALPLPEEAEPRATLLAAAITNGNKPAETYLLGKFEATPALLAKLIDNHDYKVQRRAAELGADWHAKDDTLLWKAIGENDAETIALFPRDRNFSTGTTWIVGNAVEAAVKRGDIALLDEILPQVDWKPESKARVFRELLKTPGGIELAEKHGLLPAALQTGDMFDIGGKQGAAALDSLTASGVTISDKVAAEGLRIAIQRSDAGMIGWFFARDLGRDGEIRPLLTAIEGQAEETGLKAVEKWLTREEVKPDAGLRDALNGNADLFGAPDSLALRAAYADEFPAVMKRAGAQSGFDPAVLVTTLDAHGNSLLEILGAHGRLNDILEPAAVWKDRDAVAFIKDNTPAIYHAQLDFSGLKAALDLLALAERARDNRLRLK